MASAALVLLSAGLWSSFAVAQVGRISGSEKIVTVCRKSNGTWVKVKVAAGHAQKQDVPVPAGGCPAPNRVVLCHWDGKRWNALSIKSTAAPARVRKGDKRPTYGVCPAPKQKIAVPTTTAPATTTETTTTTTTATTPTVTQPSGGGGGGGGGGSAPPATTTSTTTATSTTTTTTTTSTTTTTTTTTTPTAPSSVTTSAPADGSILGGTVVVTAAVSGTGTAPYSATLMINNGATKPRADRERLDVHLHVGHDRRRGRGYTLAVAVTDATGATATSPPLSKTVDNTKPTTFILTPDPDRPAVWTTEHPTAQAHGSDSTASASSSSDRRSAAVGPVTPGKPTPGDFTYSASLDVSTLANGSHTLTDVVTDNAGNTTTAAPVAFNVGIAPLPSPSHNRPTSPSAWARRTSSRASAAGRPVQRRAPRRRSALRSSRDLLPVHAPVEHRVPP